MYLLYLDESGDTGNWQEQGHFVIAGVGVYEFRIEALGNRLREVQKKYFQQITIPIVFHATEIHSGKGIFRTLTKEAREQLLKDLYSIMNDYRFPNIVVFGAVIGVEDAKNPFTDRSSVFEEVICGFNSFLVEGYRLQRGVSKGFGNKGLIIIDKNREEQYKQLLDTFQEEGTKYGYLANIVDIPYFARCNDTPMLQLADLCAYAIFRYYEKQDDTYFKIILPHVYKTMDGKMFGLKHITNKSCDCVSCVNQKTLLSTEYKFDKS